MMGLRRVSMTILVASLGATGLLLVGCGEKIAIPEPSGDFGTSPYRAYGDPLAVPDARHIIMDQGSVYILTATTLDWLNTSFERLGRLEGLGDARAFCVDRTGRRFYVYEATAAQVRVFERTAADFGEIAVNPVPEVEAATHMATSPRGREAAPDADTFLYLADESAGVVHRYACDAAGALTPFGVLARADGQSARFVHVPRGMVRDSADHVLVCDADTTRNWVIRFDPTPDLEDADDFRGAAAVFDPSTVCYPEAAPEDYVLGDAAACGETDWVGGPSAAVGEFHEPYSLAVDGVGGIYVADRLNDRIQKFDSLGGHLLAYGDVDKTPRPFAIAVGDQDIRPGVFLRGAFLFLLVESPGGTELRKYLSAEYYAEISRGQPPDPQ